MCASRCFLGRPHIPSLCMVQIAAIGHTREWRRVVLSCAGTVFMHCTSLLAPFAGADHRRAYQGCS